MLEAGIQVWLKTEMHDDRVVMAINVCVDSVETLEDLSEKTGECLGERNA